MVLFLTKNLQIVQEITYKQSKTGVSKNWGKRLGVYNPINGDLIVFNKQEWKVFDLIKLGRFNEIKTPDKPIVDNLIRHRIVSKEKRKISFVEIKPKDAEMYIKLTEGCNFCCSGCATSSDLIPPNKAITLDLETIQLYLRSFVKSSAEKGFKDIYIKWAGGEPLLYRPYTLLVEGVDYIKKLQKQYKNLQIHQIVLTNGVYLDEKKAQFFKENNIAISCSLWGTQKFQDLLRRPRNNTESYQTIIKNIKHLIKIGAEFNINHVITPQNAEEFNKFITIMWDIYSPDYIGADIGYNKPIPIGMTIYRYLNPPSIKTQIKRYKTIERGLRRGFAKILELIHKGIPIQPLFRFDYLNLFTVSLRTCGSGVNYVAVGPLGAANCHEGLYNMKPNIERIIKEDINLFDLVNHNHNNKSEIDYEDIPNPIFLHGGKGCPRVMGKQPITNLYENIYKELLSLEAIRQIKAHNITIN